MADVADKVLSGKNQREALVVTKTGAGILADDSNYIDEKAEFSGFPVTVTETKLTDRFAQQA